MRGTVDHLTVEVLNSSYPARQTVAACRITLRHANFLDESAEETKEKTVYSRRSRGISETSTQDTDDESTHCNTVKSLYCFESSRPVLQSLSVEARALFPACRTTVFSSTTKCSNWLTSAERSSDSSGVFVAGPKKAAALVEILVKQGAATHANITDIVVVGDDCLVQEVMCFAPEIKKSIAVQMHGVRSLAQLSATLVSLGSQP